MSERRAGAREPGLVDRISRMEAEALRLIKPVPNVRLGIEIGRRCRSPGLGLERGEIDAARIDDRELEKPPLGQRLDVGEARLSVRPSAIGIDG